MEERKIMALKINQIQERMDLVFKRWRSKNLNFDQKLLLKEFLDDLANDLVFFDKRVSKELTKEEKKESDIDRVMEGLKMNNPLRNI